MSNSTKLQAIFCVMVFIIVVMLVYPVQAQDIAYCKHGQTGDIIVIEANMVCPSGYYRI